VSLSKDEKLKRFEEARTYTDWANLYKDIFNKTPVVNAETWQQSPIKVIIDAIVEGKPIRKERRRNIDL